MDYPYIVINIVREFIKSREMILQISEPRFIGLVGLPGLKIIREIPVIMKIPVQYELAPLLDIILR